MKLKNSIQLLTISTLFSIISVTTGESVIIDSKTVEYIKYDERECPFAIDVNKNTYITSTIRLGLCKNLIKNFDTAVLNKCFEDTLNSLLNPCHVECMQSYKNSRSKECANANEGEEFLITNLQCGENHFCSANGCCVESIIMPLTQTNATTAQTTQYTTTTVTQSTTIDTTPQVTTLRHTTPTEIVKTTISTVPETSSTVESSTATRATTTAETETTTVYNTIPSDTTQPETTTAELDTTSTQETTTVHETKPPDTTPVVTTIQDITTTELRDTTTELITSDTYFKKFLCEREGNFTDEDDSHSYIHCNYNITHKSCAANAVFDEQHSTCDNGTTIICRKEGRFRNPQDCHKFYYCIDNSHGYDIMLFDCPLPLVFDETIGACNYKSDTNNCDHLATSVPDIGGLIGLSYDYSDHRSISDYSDHRLFDEYIDKSNEVVVEADVKLLELFSQSIQCIAEGYYRNPYDCHRFYHCFYDETRDPLLSIKFYGCVNGYYFDNTTGICQQLYDNSICNNELVMPELNLLPESSLEYYYR